MTISANLLLLCITQSLNIQIHFHLLYWLASFCIKIANNSGVAFSLLFSIFKKYESVVSRTSIKGNECMAVNDVCFLSLKMPHSVILVIYIHKTKKELTIKQN